MILIWYHYSVNAKLVNRNTDYAVRALCLMAKEKERVIPVSELVKRLKIPRPFLRKILQVLNKERLLISQKGKGGGFKLALAPERIFLKDLIEVFQGPLKLNECLFKKRVCPERNICALKRKIDSIERHVVSELRSVTIASLS
ncbi:MAG: Rrf2 family transcriptional regulator [Candidatus Omnitrophota bacterium]|nr:Rrf2 family transcriptional regulator [Candidatus Omnitrophota bacterium]